MYTAPVYVLVDDLYLYVLLLDCMHEQKYIACRASFRGGRGEGACPTSLPLAPLVKVVLVACIKQRNRLNMNNNPYDNKC